MGILNLKAFSAFKMTEWVEKLPEKTAKILQTPGVFCSVKHDEMSLFHFHQQ